MARKKSEREAEAETEAVSPEESPVAGVAPAPNEAPEAPETVAPTPDSVLEEARKRADDLFTRLQYAQAELENVRKRAQREVEAALRYGNEVLLASLLPALDDLDAAVAGLPEDARRGLAMVRDNLGKVLRAAGLEEIPALGEPFDPYVHECVQFVEDPGTPDGIVKEVVRKGYRLQMKVIRPAQVVVAKNGGETNG